MNEEDQILLTSCDVRCPECGKVWTSTLDSPCVQCLTCGTSIEPKRHAIIESEEEIN